MVWEPGCTGRCHWAVFALILAGLGCGRVGFDSKGANGAPLDSDAGGTTDAEGTIDAAQATITLRQTLTTNIVAAISYSCIDSDGNGYQRENSYYRIFDLPAAGIAGTFVVSSVSLGVDAARSTAGTQPLVVRLHTLSGAFVLANLTELASKTTDVPDQELTTVTVPIAATAPAGSTLVAEVMAPDGVADETNFYIGANSSGQTNPSYRRAPDCDGAEPVDVAQIGHSSMHIVLEVTGVYTP